MIVDLAAASSLAVRGQIAMPQVLAIASLSVASATIAAFLALCFTIGVFNIPHFVRESRGKMVLFGRTYTGAYRNIGSTFEAIEKIRTTCGLETSCGVYYDDPKKVPEDECRAFVAVALHPEQVPAHRSHLIEVGLKEVSIPASTFHVARWPMASFPLETISIILAVTRVYAAAQQQPWADAVQGCMEVYRAPSVHKRHHSRTIEFCFALDNGDAFRSPPE
mmetsp:Transcript_14351/g.38729  ORF Transcript_14351/g.38729 Transcript_14351/m.38729 type:complete len:221 (+) Transcript_14351:93-755(+)|eukprot:CAMPEP_0185161262 /NCGR_PEP_ID=MMETSP1139-20130426/4761_1 /TAXON_ID=298111 /ORGANISM="Pavlova sp., Strain CCMP459" /LENGTH=220 /DNA_ID=CAMNT_0027726515 /DNA_START=74 /DNA_END=736 /DNA_ORIENTATION=-